MRTGDKWHTIDRLGPEHEGIQEEILSRYTVKLITCNLLTRACVAMQVSGIQICRGTHSMPSRCSLNGNTCTALGETGDIKRVLYLQLVGSPLVKQQWAIQFQKY